MFPIPAYYEDLFSSNDNIKDLFNNANLELNEIFDWFKANKPSLNERKTKHTFFNKFRQKKKILVKLPMLWINGKIIELTTSIKFLGIFLDEHLSWKNHKSVVENKVSKNIGNLFTGKNTVRKGGLKSIYFSFVHSHLNYGNIASGNTIRTKLKKLASKQKQVIRAIKAAEHANEKKLKTYKLYQFTSCWFLCLTWNEILRQQLFKTISENYLIFILQDLAKIGEGKILSNQTKFAVLSRAPRVWSRTFTLFKMDLFRAAHG